jgi:hypothetical protein
VPASEHEAYGTSNGGIDGWPVSRLRYDSTVRCTKRRESKSSEWVYRNASDGLPKGGHGRVAISLAKPQRPDRVPRVRAALATVQMPIVFGRELAFESLESGLTLVARQVNEAP